MNLSSAKWFKSSYSEHANGCVEAAFLDDGGVAVRDTKNRDGGTLIFTPTEWDSFLLGAHNGEFNRP